ncbi:hypothetical protein KM043_003062 [Ampulex compressa]|nr:hypothetical protein KM043_003062 [Ampulex compressa]
MEAANPTIAEELATRPKLSGRWPLGDRSVNDPSNTGKADRCPPAWLPDAWTLRKFSGDEAATLGTAEKNGGTEAHPAAKTPPSICLPIFGRLEGKEGGEK